MDEERVMTAFASHFLFSLTMTSKDIKAEKKKRDLWTSDFSLYVPNKSICVSNGCQCQFTSCHSGKPFRWHRCCILSSQAGALSCGKRRTCMCCRRRKKEEDTELIIRNSRLGRRGPADKKERGPGASGKVRSGNSISRHFPSTSCLLCDSDVSHSFSPPGCIAKQGQAFHEIYTVLQEILKSL